MVLGSKVLINTRNQSKNNRIAWKPYGEGRGWNHNHDKWCSYCQKMNYIADKCFPKHRLPSWYKHKSNHVVNNIVSHNKNYTVDKFDNVDQEGQHTFNQENV